MIQRIKVALKANLISGRSTFCVRPGALSICTPQTNSSPWKLWAGTIMLQVKPAVNYLDREWEKRIFRRWLRASRTSRLVISTVSSGPTPPSLQRLNRSRPSTRKMTSKSDWRDRLGIVWEKSYGTSTDRRKMPTVTSISPDWATSPRNRSWSPTSSKAGSHTLIRSWKCTSRSSTSSNCPLGMVWKCQ